MPRGCAPQAREKGRQEPYEAQQRETPSLASGEETPMSQDRLGADRLENSLRVHEPAMVPLQQRRPAASWIMLGVVLPAG